jgi:hypothetical protein
MKHMHALGLRLFFACTLVFFVAGCGEQQAEQAEKTKLLKKRPTR